MLGSRLHSCWRICSPSPPTAGAIPPPAGEPQKGKESEIPPVRLRLGISKASLAPWGNFWTDHAYERKKKIICNGLSQNQFFGLCKVKLLTTFRSFQRQILAIIYFFDSTDHQQLWPFSARLWWTVKWWCPYPPLTFLPVRFSRLTRHFLSPSSAVWHLFQTSQYV